MFGGAARGTALGAGLQELRLLALQRDAMGGAGGADHLVASLAARARPQRRRGVEPERQPVGGGLVIDPPSVEVLPGLVLVSLELPPDRAQPLDGIVELGPGEL